MSDDFASFAPPPFDPAAALLQLKRSLRDLKLAERGNGCEWKGKPVLRWALGDGVLTMKTARQWVAAPDWDIHTLKSAADQRKLLDEVKKRLERWQRED
jgi:hypothetical protein